MKFFGWLGSLFGRTRLDKRQTTDPFIGTTSASGNAGLMAGKSYLFSETAGKTNSPTHTAKQYDHNLPHSVQVDSDSMAKHQEILAYCEAHKVDYTTAVMAIG
ncbi:MAG: hypothetical protein Q4B79_02680 [Moraxella sp.]|uniref:hypothetical protein n=1 Tax=Moraxella sp. TaxID=479 RepID=UPI0026DCD880|nr:hypothetical protein [Moraxella sp.]MDO4449846.1 hypothetical protein [Moraxella sp.]